jgi:hypothetical protein
MPDARAFGAMHADFVFDSFSLKKNEPAVDLLLAGRPKVWLRHALLPRFFGTLCVDANGPGASWCPISSPGPSQG